MIDPILRVEDLYVSFGSHEAVKGLSFDINAHETVALVGESGSGKSATALSILRLIEREGGQIAKGRIALNDGKEVIDVTGLSGVKLNQFRGDKISMVFQEPMTSLNPVLTIGNQLAELYTYHRGMTMKEALDASVKALNLVRIPDAARRLKQYPHELSGGLRQRVMIAMALACRPKLLIADEPTTALDVTTQAEILNLIRALQGEIGMAILFITHDMGVVAEIADRVVVLKDGIKQEEANVTDLFSKPKADYSRRLMAATPKLGSGTDAVACGARPVMTVRNLSTRFPLRKGLLRKVHANIHAVRDVSFTLNEGETLGLVGESGCGKSTLARSVLRLIEPAEGSIEINGTTLTGLASDRLRAARKNAQMIFQDPFASLNPRLPVHELITEPARIHGMVSARDSKDLAASLVEKVGLETGAIYRYPHQFSGGQRQRLCIARALSVQPKLIIADEAVSALDVSIARQVTDLMLDLQAREKVSFLFISHDIAVVERISQRIAVMYAGQIVEMGPSGDVLSDPLHDYTRRLLSAVPSPDPQKRHLNTSLGSTPPPRVVLEVGQELPAGALVEKRAGHFILEQVA
nr:ABC transporter ATP-binding protein [uncultured Cohaesibacter sp.]